MIGFDSAAFRRGFWRGAMAGTVAGLVVALLLWPAPARASDDGPAVAVATSGDGATVTLHAGRGRCVGMALAAYWRPGPGDDRAPVPGCWVVTEGGLVLVSFLDGERGNIPAAHLVRAKAS